MVRYDAAYCILSCCIFVAFYFNVLLKKKNTSQVQMQSVLQSADRVDFCIVRKDLGYKGPGYKGLYKDTNVSL